MLRRRSWLSILVVAAPLLLAGCTSERERQLALVPEALGVSSVVYAYEEGGIGLPGDNETGIIVYEMPLAFRRDLEERGLEFLKTFPETLRDGSPTYLPWSATPVHANNDWPPRSSGTRYRIRDYTDQYVSSGMDPAIETMVNDALATPGNFILQHKGGSRLVVLIPGAKRVVLAYAG